MLESLFDSYWYWFSLATLLLLLEIIVPGIFLLWLGVGASFVGVFLLLFPQAGLAWQLFALIVSISAAVALGLKWQKRILKSQPTTLNLGLEGYLERTAVVSQAFSQGRGRVSIDDSSYPAICAEDCTLEVGQAVVIVATQETSFVVAAK
ncbi:NfeD family protein [Thiopseudomonas acetoxidans]|uniref:NfeD family protein n=1 Tax=Thiopseudomonas acetoxidans TaxID=3041622 RepID=A0ABT7SQC4_9GAMM|nr:NfeD family protein [Thiopseudomonas sp. CY1220]MDM7858393.1 NfeD family protein [Thiopseudomonas sp. CY1220]NLC08527.1 NfeD family protein [Gammaproteobacteria bacterium]